VEERVDRGSRLSTIVVGLLLIGIGVVFLAVQSFGMDLPFDLSRVGWPLYIIAPGVVLLLVGLLLPDAGAGLAIAGGIVSTVGLLLAYQSTYDHYASWAYAWALVAPTSVGASMLLWGLLHRRGGVARDGLGALAVGVVLFLVGFAFFEGLLNIGGERGWAPLGRQALPVALIAAGVLLILTRLWPGGRQRRWGDWQPRPPARQTETGIAGRVAASDHEPAGAPAAQTDREE
jgi:hypothetical protein